MPLAPPVGLLTMPLTVFTAPAPAVARQQRRRAAASARTGDLHHAALCQPSSALVSRARARKHTAPERP